MDASTDRSASKRDPHGITLRQHARGLTPQDIMHLAVEELSQIRTNLREAGRVTTQSLVKQGLQQGTKSGGIL